MENNESIILKTLTTQEIPVIMKELGTYAHINLSEREFRKTLAEKDVYKIMLDNAPFGIVAIAPKSLAEITVWLSDTESDEKWSGAIRKIISKTYEKPDVYKIKWLLAESSKKMIALAASCGFEKEGDLRNEGPSGETMISFGHSSSSAKPNSSPKQNTSSEKDKDIAENLRKKVLFLESELKIANLKIENLQKEIRQLNDELAKEAEKTKKAQQCADPTPALTGDNGQKIASLEKTVEQLKSENIKLDALANEKIRENSELSATVAGQEKMIAELQRKNSKLNPKTAEVLKKIIKSGLGGILQKDIYNGGNDLGLNQNSVSLAVKKLVEYDLVENKPEGKASRATPKFDKIREQFPEFLENQEKKESITPGITPQETALPEPQKTVEIKIPEPTKQSEPVAARPAGKENNGGKPSAPNPFWIIVNILKEYSALGKHGIDSSELNNKIEEKTKGEIPKTDITQAIREITQLNILVKWGGTTFYTIQERPLTNLSK